MYFIVNQIFCDKTFLRNYDFEVLATMLVYWRSTPRWPLHTLFKTCLPITLKKMLWCFKIWPRRVVLNFLQFSHFGIKTCFFYASEFQYDMFWCKCKPRITGFLFWQGVHNAGVHFIVYFEIHLCMCMYEGVQNEFSCVLYDPIL